MKYNCNKNAFLLIEVLITVAVLSTAVVFLFRAFAMSLASTRLAHDISQACLLAEEKMEEISLRQLKLGQPLAASSGQEEIEGRTFKWNQESTPSQDEGILLVKCSVSWKEGRKEKDHHIELSSLILPEKK